MLTQVRNVVREEVKPPKSTRKLDLYVVRLIEDWVIELIDGETLVNDDTKIPSTSVEIFSILPSKFKAGADQISSLKGDILPKEVKKATLSEDVATKPTIIQFTKPSKTMTKHLKPLCIKAFINDRLVSRVFINGGVILNVMPVITLKKLGKNKTNLIATNIRMSNFIGEATTTMRDLVAKITVGLKTLNSAFFMVNAKLTHFVLLRRDWIHFSQSIPLLLY